MSTILHALGWALIGFAAGLMGGAWLMARWIERDDFAARMTFITYALIIVAVCFLMFP